MSTRAGKGVVMMLRLMCVAWLFLMQTTHADDAQLKRGAVFFRNYCSGCHTLRYMRPDSITGKPSLMENSMHASDARQWFGRMPPDLSLSAREHGRLWLYTYLTSFYPDHSRPFGANNTLVPDVAMPNVLYPLKNQTKLKDDLQDVVSFLVYVAEPVRLIRYRMGLVVMGFLMVLAVLVYPLKRWCWRALR